MKNKKWWTLLYYLLLLVLLVALSFVVYEIAVQRKNEVLFSTLIALYVLNLIFNLIVFVQDRPAESKQSWQFIFALIPLVGHALYILFGQKYIKRMSVFKYRKESDEALRGTEKYSIPEYFNSDSVFNIKKIAKMNNRQILPANIVTFDNGFYLYKDIFKELLKAKKYIFIETYIIKPGEIFDYLKTILVQKVKEGLDVRLLVDDFGSWDVPRSLFKDLQNDGVKVVFVEKIVFPFITGTSNYRTHRKYFVIDGKITYTGGCNISDEYAGFSKRYGIWQDGNMKLTGPANDFYLRLFAYDWKKQTNKEIENLQNLYHNHKNTEYKNYVTSIEDGPICDFPLLESTMIKILADAKESVAFSTPYFVPSTRFEMALRDVLAQGIKVTIYIPGAWDKGYVYNATISTLKSFLKYGLKVKIVKNSFVHTKMALVDNQIAYLGTLNLDSRSFYSQFEIANFFIGEAVEDIQKIFEKYDRLHDEEAYQRIFTKKDSQFIKNLRKLFKPVL